MSGEILFLSHRMPFPPDRGDKIRSHHVLRRLARQGPVHVATFADDERDISEEVELAAIARSYRLVRRVKPLIVAGLQSLLKRQPVSLPAFHSAELTDYVIQVLAERPISAIYAFSGQMGQYIPDSFEGRVIYDFVDVDSAKFEAYADKARGVERWLYAREGRLLRLEERRLARRSDVSLLVSFEEAALFRGRLAEGEREACDVRTLRNGIDSRHFDPAQIEPAAELAAKPGPRLLFSGQMDYAPNVEAALRAVDRLLPLVRARLPQATLHIVGRNPVEELLAQHGKDGVYVWGAVDDMRSYIAAADVALIPLDIARGVQNKVLEAMAMALPVVLTSEAATGIGAQDGRHLLIADTDEGLADHVISLAQDPARASAVGHEARRFVVDTLSWQATLAPLVDLLADCAPGSRDAA
ncbi:sugar transferase (PEP-CTERM/EpsH1 system associated) [Novosphingobium kunmingense]|uniref:Sugar transferase (PEP-CTERM/EpsH1 system associated) n=1 Tax=Novosphingobium kunmingense TaxID=1211806 RepID=A0A2N0I330_9SPHN|nr:TIGR03087 family PEP-CTERM/XrtA system glycosyltransferase [Novosphingobium kunmingense]PKB25592.1 sugar transferase (PEP-CTERM/EpsH1 system associated) [Novosphingobium kunmingense]